MGQSVSGTVCRMIRQTATKKAPAGAVTSAGTFFVAIQLGEIKTMRLLDLHTVDGEFTGAAGYKAAVEIALTFGLVDHRAAIILN